MFNFSPEDRKKLEEKFFTDPDFHIIRKAVQDRMLTLDGLASINADLPAEDVKCQVKGHKVAQQILGEFFMACGILEKNSSLPSGETDFR
jgi:hypothetical protein